MAKRNTTGDPLTYKVYVVTNTVNGKVYVGQTYLADGEARFKSHVYHALCRPDKVPKNRFARAIRKHGGSAFVVETVTTGIETEEEVNVEEMRLIAELHADDPRFGYNSTKGGDGCRASAQTKAKQSAAQQGVTVQQLVAIHKESVKAYNDKVSYKDINAMIFARFGVHLSSKLAVTQHRANTCRVCTDPVQVTRSPSSKPADFGKQVSGWKRGSKYTQQQRIDSMLRKRKQTLEEAREMDVLIVRLFKQGAKPSAVAAASGKLVGFVQTIRRRHAEGTCILCQS
jgi:hypothetical protein